MRVPVLGWLRTEVHVWSKAVVGSEPMRQVIAACAMQSRSTTKSGKSWPMALLIFDLRPFRRRVTSDSGVRGVGGAGEMQAALPEAVLSTLTTKIT